MSINGVGNGSDTTMSKVDVDPASFVKSGSSYKDMEGSLPTLDSDKAESASDELNVRKSLFEFIQGGISNMSDQALEAFLLNVATEFSESQRLTKQLYRKLFLAEVDTVHLQQTASAEKTREGADKVLTFALIGLGASLAVGGGSVAMGLKGVRKGRTLSKDATQLRSVEKQLSFGEVNEPRELALRNLNKNIEVKPTETFKFNPKNEASLSQAGFTKKEISDLEIGINQRKQDAASVEKYLNDKANEYTIPAEKATLIKNRIEAFEEVGAVGQQSGARRVAEELGDESSDLYKKLNNNGAFSKEEIQNLSDFFKRNPNTRLFTPGKATGSSPWQETINQFKGAEQRVSRVNILKSELNADGLSAQERLDKGEALKEATGERDVFLRQQRQSVHSGTGFSQTQSDRLSGIAKKDILMQAILSFGSIGGQVGNIGEARVKGEEYYEAQLLDADATQSQSDQSVKSDIVSSSEGYQNKAGDLMRSAVDLAAAKNAFFTK